MIEAMTCLGVREGDVSHERLDGEVIAIHLRTGRYYSMGGAAADAWTLLLPGAQAGAIAAELGRVFSSDKADLDAIAPFLDALLAAGLVEVRADPGPSAVLPDDYPRDRWVAPRLEEFDDMQDLILVDPVHDTSELGWPHTEPAGG